MGPRAPEQEKFRAEIVALREHSLLGGLIEGDVIRLGELATEQVNQLIRGREAAYYFLIAAAGLDRTAIKREMDSPEARLVTSRLRRAHVVRDRLPISGSFRSISETAIALRTRDLKRRKAGTTESLFRDRLEAEGVPILMSPPVRSVPGVLISKRKPDGVYPDPSSGKPPIVYLEVKRVRRVSDDIQKRLYEIAEASLEMKAVYGTINLKGLGFSTTEGIADNEHVRASLRAMIEATPPKVVALLICPRDEAERYRAGGQAFIDRIFFQEEVEECVEYLRAVIEQHDGS